MSLDRETVMQITLSSGAVVLFIAAAVFVSSMYGTNGNLSEQGGFALVGAMAAFILLMLGAGLWLERREF